MRGVIAKELGMSTLYDATGVWQSDDPDTFSFGEVADGAGLSAFGDTVLFAEPDPAQPDRQFVDGSASHHELASVGQQGRILVDADWNEAF